MCLDRAPRDGDGNGPDRSRADYVWCISQFVDETAARLLQESRKAREEGESYAAQTVRQAANAVERRRREQPSKSELSSSGAVEARHQRDG
ncbi:MAG: hypothetical protein WB611_33105 [Stellaceae bacterium]